MPEMRRNLRSRPKSVATGEGSGETGRSRKFQVSSLPFEFPNACHYNFIDLP